MLPTKPQHSRSTITSHTNLGSCELSLSVEKKCLLVTTRSNLAAARAWIDENLEPMVRQSIPEGINPPSAQLPCRLDKPTYTAASQSYADILKKQFSLATDTSAATKTDITRPPRKRQATKLDYDSDTTEENQQSTTVTTNNTTSANTTKQNNSKPTITASNATNYANELLSLKAEIDSLKAVITAAVEQFKCAIQSLTVNPSPASSAMETNTETAAPALHDMEMNADQSPTATKSDISDLIADLKHDIATVAIEMRAIVDLKSDIALIKSHSLFRNLPPINQQVPVT